MHQKIIFDVLGIGFNEICPVGKQLFIDVALFAPPPDEDEDIFNWLVVIHADLNANKIRLKNIIRSKVGLLSYQIFWSDTLCSTSEVYCTFCQESRTHREKE